MDNQCLHVWTPEVLSLQSPIVCYTWQLPSCLHRIERLSIVIGPEPGAPFPYSVRHIGTAYLQHAKYLSSRSLVYLPNPMYLISSLYSPRASTQHKCGSPTLFLSLSAG